MALIRTFVRLDTDGKIPLPRNIRTVLGVKAQDLIEIRTVGPSQSKRVVVSVCKNAR